MDADTKTERENEGLKHDPNLASRPSQNGVIACFEYEYWSYEEMFVGIAPDAAEAEEWRLRRPAYRLVRVVPVGIPEEE